jgi:hypothetical protein
MAAALLNSCAHGNAGDLSPNYAEDVNAVANKVCFSSMTELIVSVDPSKTIDLSDRRIDWSGPGSESFWRTAEQVVQNLNRDRVGGTGFVLYVSPVSTDMAKKVGRELSAGVLCENGSTPRCRNRNFWSASDIDNHILAEIVVRETIRDVPLVKSCREKQR